MGYTRIALGGMVPLKTPDILDCLRAISEIRTESTELHLLGITRVDTITEFASLGVTSFDSTSAFRQSFMDDRDNYHTETTTYSSIRVPQVDGNLTLKRAILSGKVAQRDAVLAERECLRALREYDQSKCDLDKALSAVLEYEAIVGVKKSYVEEYKRTLRDAPWKDCICGLCSIHGIEIAIFRGLNETRGEASTTLQYLLIK